MYCSNCGKEINDKAVICIGCGVAVGNKESKQLQEKVGGSKFNTLTLVLSLASIFLTSLVFIFMSLAISIDVGTWNTHIEIKFWGITAGWILAGAALSAGIISTIFCYVYKQSTRFRSLLSLMLPLLSIIFLILSTVIYGIN